MAENYEIVGQRQTVDITPDGRFGDVMEVTYTTVPSGIVGTVRIPMRTYNRDQVDRVVTDAAARIEDVQGL